MWGTRRDPTIRGKEMDVYQDCFMYCGQLAMALLLVGIVVWLLAVFSRHAVGRLEVKRKKEAEEQRAQGKTWGAVSRWERLLAVWGTFAIGAVVELLLSGWRSDDMIFRQYVPWSGIYAILLSGVMWSSLGLAASGSVSFPKTSCRNAVWAFAVLALSFVIHLADAFSFWGHGMSFIACVRGFSERFYFAAVGVLLLVAMCAIATPLVLCLKPMRRDLMRCNLTCELYLGNGFRLLVWFGLLGLLAYETLILIWLNLAF